VFVLRQAPPEMKKLSWNSFCKKIHIKAPIEQIYACWTTEEGICAWFLSSASYYRGDIALKANLPVETGDRYCWRWHNWDGKEEGIVLGTIPNKEFRFSFAGQSEVTVSLEQREQAVLLSLEQSKIPQDEKSKLEIFYGCSNGWTFWLANLKAFLEHGILLNETDIDLRGFDLAGYEFVNM